MQKKKENITYLCKFILSANFSHIMFSMNEIILWFHAINSELNKSRQFIIWLKLIIYWQEAIEKDSQFYHIRFIEFKKQLSHYITSYNIYLKWANFKQVSFDSTLLRRRQKSLQNLNDPNVRGEDERRG